MPDGLSNGVHRFLVTSELGPRMDMWVNVGHLSNWIEGRDTERLGEGHETWLVTVMAEHREQFLTVARTVGVTVEELQGIDPRPILRVGEPATGWAKPEATDV
jgi:hypothetical protein